jgi:hypothetical protein
MIWKTMRRTSQARLFQLADLHNWWKWCIRILYPLPTASVSLSNEGLTVYHWAIGPRYILLVPGIERAQCYLIQARPENAPN